MAGEDSSQYRKPWVSKLFIIKLCKFVVPLLGSPITKIGDFKFSTLLLIDLWIFTPSDNDLDDNGEPPTEIDGVKVTYDGHVLLSEELVPTPLWNDINNNVVIPSNIKDTEKISEIVLQLLKEVEKLDHRKHKIKENNLVNNLENNLEKIINFINEK